MQHGKLQSMQDRSKYFSVDQYRQQLKLKIQSSQAFEETEHQELRDILKKVMKRPAHHLASQTLPSQRDEGKSRGNMSLQDIVASKTIDAAVPRRQSHEPFSHSILIALKKNIEAGRDYEAVQTQRRLGSTREMSQLSIHHSSSTVELEN